MKKKCLIVGKHACVEFLNSPSECEDWVVLHFADINQLPKDERLDDFMASVVVLVLDSDYSDSIEYFLSLSNKKYFGANAEYILMHDIEQEDSSKQKVLRILEEQCFTVLSPPVKQRSLLLALGKAFRAAQVKARLARYDEAQTHTYAVDQFIGMSAEAKKVRQLISKLIRIPITSLLISGETGTGKGVVARILHNNGQRGDGPLIELNCAAIPREMLESELFGHEAGAFTGANKRHCGVFEQADGGTLFLDEIGDMDIDLQAKILKALEDQSIRRLGGEKEISIDVQLFAATHQDIAQAIGEGLFREDLYHRLSVFSLELPPLRSRPKDLLELVPHFIAHFNSRSGKSVKYVPETAWEEFYSYQWPGNIRELTNVIERCVLLSEGSNFPTEWMQLNTQKYNHTEVGGSLPEENKAADSVTIPLDGSMSLEKIEQTVILSMLKQCDSNVSKAARKLGVSREKLRYRIKKYNQK